MASEAVSGHQMKFISMKCVGDFVFTFGIDGIMIIRVADTKDCITVFPTHHRWARGIKTVVVDTHLHYVVALGKSGSLVCTLIRKSMKVEGRCNSLLTHPCPPSHGTHQHHPVPEKVKVRGIIKYLQEQENFSDEPQSERMWLTLREFEKNNTEELKSRKEKQRIQEEFWDIKQKLKELLDENFSNIPERQLPIQMFDLDKAGRRKKLDDGKFEREREKQLQLASMKNYNKITSVIRKICWDSVEVKGRDINAILIPVNVHSYAMFPESKSHKEKMTWLPERLSIERYFRKGDYFEPWVPRTESDLESHIKAKFKVSTLDVTQNIKTKFEEEPLEDGKEKADVEDNLQKFVWTGTSTHNFVEVDPNHCTQFELTTFLQSHQEIQLIEVDIKKLMLFFNKKFTDTFYLKEREMAYVHERNNRFRHIIKELNFFNFSPNICRTPIHDPKWTAEENPESLMMVDDREIPVPMYISESELEMIRKKKQEEERLRQLLAADDFRERALMAMMDGVLEKLWENEIKRDIPKPKCMVEKDPETYTEEDIKVIKAYEEAVKLLSNDRERYRKILETEWSKNISMLKDSVYKFDEKVIKLHFLKLKVEAAINQEILKCLRIRQRCYQRVDMDKKEERIKASQMKNEKKIESMTSELGKLTELLNDCKNFYESLLNKDRNLDKNFKKDFSEYSPFVSEQLYKQSKRRPKLLQKAATCATILNDMGKCIISGTKPEYMPVECIQYIKDIEALDASSNMPANVSQQSWELACKLRRTKIECELKIKACALEVADAEATVSNYQKLLKAAKDRQLHLQNDLQVLRNEKLQASINYQIQLVLKKGYVEIPLTGRLSDFNECALVTKKILRDVNQAINTVGNQKLKAMKTAANFRKGIIYKEWEHKKLRMEIEDLKSQLDTVEKMQVLKELQAILVAKARGFTDEKGFLYLENELAKVKEKFGSQKIKTFKKIEEFNAKIKKIDKQNKDLEEKIVELNVQINEMNLEMDEDFEKKNYAENHKKMKKVRERSKLVRIIQEKHNEILMLQTELELLRLKTYPIITNTVIM